MATTARAQVPVIDSSSSDAPAPTPPAKPAPAPLDLQQPGASPAPAPAPPPAAAAPARDQTVESSKQTGGLQGSGVGVGVSGERVVKLHDPTNHFWQFAIDGGFMYGTSTKSGVSASIYGGGADINIQYRVGGQMPGTGGGSWSAFGLDLSGGFFGAGLVLPDPTDANNSNGAGVLVVTGDVAAGYQFLTFGKMDDEDLKQHGFGLFLGGKVGVANTQILQSQSIPAQSSTNAQYGPEIQLTFPEYNFGNTKRAAFYISGFLLPTGDFLFFNIQLGGSFN
jgi:hypothetical protein